MHILRFTPTVPNATQEYISNRKSAHIIIIIMMRMNIIYHQGFRFRVLPEEWKCGAVPFHYPILTLMWLRNIIYLDLIKHLIPLW